MSALRLVGASLAFSTVVGAQGAFEGVLYDSLIAGAAVANAEVVLRPSGQRARTDSLGRFRFEGSPAQGARVAFWAPWLDSLGLPALEAAVPADGRPLHLTTPSRATYTRRLCGQELDRDVGVLLGEVRDLRGTPVGALPIAGVWEERRIGPGQMVEGLMATADTTTGSGMFVLCGVPLDVAVTVRALATDVRTGVRSVILTRFVQRMDLVAGRDAERATISGRVRDQRGTAIAGARIELAGDRASVATSDSAGVYRITVPQRSGEIVIRSVGFAPMVVPVDASDLRGDERAVTLEPVPPELDRVVVTADPYAHERRGFEERRAGATGYFITEEMLAPYPSRTADVFALLVPRLGVERGLKGVRVLKLRRGAGFCSPRFYRDGVDEGVLDRDRTVEQVLLLQDAKRVEVYTANQAPPRYNDNDGCGVVLVWTR